MSELARAIPPFRGKTRMFLELYRLLRLHEEHVTISSHLRKPVPYRAQLDLHAWAQRVAFLTGGYEDDTVQFLLRLHAMDGRNGYLLDVGANVGLIAIPFAKSIDRSPLKVVAIEAVADNARVLTANIALNDLGSSVSVVEAALGEQQKSGFIQVEGDLEAGEGTGTASILPDGSTYDCVRQEIRVETLDSLRDSGAVPRGCTVVKIDTDGYDLKVLQGAEAFLAGERPVIYGEFDAVCMKWHSQTVSDVIAFAGNHGFDVARRIGPGWRFSTSIDVATYRNDLLLIPRETRSRYDSCLVS